MVHDIALRWIVTLLFVFSAGVCVQAILANRHSGPNVISHSLHAIMAIAMAVMAWPRGAQLPSRVPMIFFAVAATWFAVSAFRTADHRGANAYHTLMMLAMAWMYAAMGGLPLQRAGHSGSPMSPASGMDMTDMPAPAASSGHAGHAGHSGHAGHAGAGQAGTDHTNWVGLLNGVFAVGFAAAAAFWLYRLITARLQSTPGDSHQTVGILCQLAMAAGMAIMFAVML